MWPPTPCLLLLLLLLLLHVACAKVSWLQAARFQPGSESDSQTVRGSDEGIGISIYLLCCVVLCCVVCLFCMLNVYVCVCVCVCMSGCVCVPKWRLHPVARCLHMRNMRERREVKQGNDQAIAIAKTMAILHSFQSPVSSLPSSVYSLYSLSPVNCPNCPDGSQGITFKSVPSFSWELRWKLYPKYVSAQTANTLRKIFV